MAAEVAAPIDCPACHHRAHDPGSCEECPRCELHTDDALAFVEAVDPDLLVERGYVRAEMLPVYVIFDGPPSHDSGRFVEVEDPAGASVGTGASWSNAPGSPFWRFGPLLAPRRR